MKPHALTLPAELLTSFAWQSQWHLHGRTTDGQHCRSVNAERAWCRQNGYGSEEVVIAFADDGCQMDAIASGRDDKFVAAAFLEQGRLIYDDPQKIKAQMFVPGYSHGTALAGLMAGTLSTDLPGGWRPDAVCCRYVGNTIGTFALQRRVFIPCSPGCRIKQIYSSTPGPACHI